MTATPPAPPPAAPDPPATPPPAAAPTSGTEGGNLADRVNTIEGKLDQVLGALHGKAAGVTAAKLDEHTDMEEAARREIARLREEDQRQAAADADKATITGLQADVAALKETPPAAPVRKIERLMWPGRRG